VRAVKCLSLSFTRRAERDAMLFNRRSALLPSCQPIFIIYSLFTLSIHVLFTGLMLIFGVRNAFEATIK
jgi:hypothetical protein